MCAFPVAGAGGARLRLKSQLSKHKPLSFPAPDLACGGARVGGAGRGVLGSSLQVSAISPSTVQG